MANRKKSRNKKNNKPGFEYITYRKLRNGKLYFNIR